MRFTLILLKTIKPEISHALTLTGGTDKLFLSVTWLPLFVFAALMVATPAMPAATLVHHWTFDDSTSGSTAVDSVGGLNITLSGGAALSTTQAVSGGALLISGSANRALTASTTLPGTFTLTGWVYVSNTANQLQSLVHNTTASDGTGNGFRTFIDFRTDQSWENTLPISTISTTATTRVVVTEDDTATAGDWIHFAYVINRPGETVAIYVNGVDKTNLADNDIWNNFNLTAPLSFGQHNQVANSNFWLRGYLDDVQIYDGLLTSQEVSFLSQNAGSVVPEPYVSGLLFMGSLGLLLSRRR